MKEEIIDHVKNVRVDEDQINDLINKISDIKNKDKYKDQKNTYIDIGNR